MRFFTIFTFFILISILTTSLATARWAGTLSQKCLKSYCHKYFQTCLNDLFCMQGMKCLERCGSNDDIPCLEGCYNNMRTNTNFWSLNLCDQDCISSNLTTYYSDGFDELYNCWDKCEWNQCIEDQVCEEALKCTYSCHDGDYKCSGKCISKYSDNVKLINLFKCTSFCDDKL